MHKDLVTLAALAAACTLASVVACSRGIDLGPTTTHAGTGGGRASSPASSTGAPASSTSATTTSSAASSTGGGGAGGASSSSTSTAASTSATSSSSSGVMCPALAPSTGPCSMQTCALGGTPCLAAAPQMGASTFALRVAHLSVQQPATLAAGVVGTVLDGAVTPSVHSCNLKGAATFNWILRFDLASGTITTGGAKPVTNAVGPYTFANDTFTFGSASFQLAPASVVASFGGCAIDSSDAPEVVLPLYLDEQGANVILLPLHRLRFSAGTFSDDHSCIGAYDGAGLDPSNGCSPDAQHPLFLDGGSVSGYFLVAESDQVPVEAVGESLCVLLSGDPSTYGDGAQPVAHCKTGPGSAIQLEGDWCAATDQPATTTCHDALHFDATFAASGVELM